MIGTPNEFPDEHPDEKRTNWLLEAIKKLVNGNKDVKWVEQDCDEIVIGWQDGGQSNIEVDSQDYVGN